MPGFEEEGRASDTFETIPTESQYLPNGIIHPPQTRLRPSLLSLNIFSME